MSITDMEEKEHQAKHLRQRAEEALRGKPVDLENLHTDDIQYLLHEMQVYQAELAIQNEELRRVQLDLEISRDLYSDLYNFAPSGYCTLSKKDRILNANETLEEILGVDHEKLLHRRLSEFVDGGSQDEYFLHRYRAIENCHREVSEIQMVKPEGRRMLVRIESVIARRDSSQLMVMISDITEQRRLEAQQQESAVRMMLQRRLIEQSEMERVELARNLHDGPIQSLAGLGFSIQIIKEILKENGVDGNANIQQMGDDIKSLIAELRNICNNLRPPLLAKLGLLRAIEENVEELQTKDPDMKINLDLSNDPPHLPNNISLALYRIYQQAMNNIYSHSKANEVWIRLKLDPERIVFEIQDNGQGMQIEHTWMDYVRQGHLGLMGMNERAEVLGGTLQLISQPGKGTTVQVIIPLQR